MSMTYVWEIHRLESKTVNGNEDSIELVHWAKIGIADDDTRVRFCGVTPISSEDTTNFTPYADLTEAQVIEWVKAAISPEEMVEVDKFLEENLAEKRNPTTTKRNPWD